MRPWARQITGCAASTLASGFTSSWHWCPTCVHTLCLVKAATARLTFLAAFAPGLCADASFIRVRDGTFADENCTEFTFSGYNTWQVRRGERGLSCCQRLPG